MEIKGIYPFIHSFIYSHTHACTYAHITYCTTATMLSVLGSYTTVEQYCEAVIVIPVSKMNKLKIREFLSHEFNLRLNLELMIFPIK